MNARAGEGRVVISNPRRLSLRARMLILLIGVTAVFLLIMGAVTTFVLTGLVNNAFNADLNAAAANGPVKIADNTGGYVAAAVSVYSRQVVPITQDRQTSELEAALSQMTGPEFRATFAGGPATLPLPDGQTVRATVRRYIDATELGRAKIYAAQGRYVLVVAHSPASVNGQVSGVVAAELITGGALLALLAIGGSWLIGRGLEPLEEMATTANAITSRGDLTARVADADGRTEVGRLGSAINTMLDRIQQAFAARLRSEQKVREFAADASHELRTPLTTIRGYAELYRQGALGPDQLPNAMRRIEQEAQRMSTLVAELLELARLDRTSSLDLTETDLASVVRDAVADAVAVEPERTARAEAPPQLVAVVDEPRIRQVLANLLGNVRAHTPATAAVAVRLAVVTGGVLLEVADAGPGMPEEDAARAFDRFHRVAEQPGPADVLALGLAEGEAPSVADSRLLGRLPGDSGSGGTRNGLAAGHSSAVTDPAGSSRPATGRVRAGSREWAAGGGSGLGLSIVQAIAIAHDGRATLESWPGRGTRVRVWLPDRTTPPALRAASCPSGQAGLNGRP